MKSINHNIHKKLMKIRKESASMIQPVTSTKLYNKLYKTNWNDISMPIYNDYSAIQLNLIENKRSFFDGFIKSRKIT